MSLIFRGIFLMLMGIPLCGFSQQFTNGQWKGVIQYKTVEVPFNFSLKKTSDTSALVTLINAKERIIIENAVIKSDSIFIPMFVFDTYIKAKIEGNTMVGVWHKNYKPHADTKFTAAYNQPRFSKKSSKINSIKPTWDIIFKQPNGQTSKAIGLFAQHNNRVTGTIATQVGDFRYFEGVTYNDSIRISSFDGVHAFLMTGAFKNGNWSGVFHYEDGYSEKWTSTYNSEATLTNPFSLITVEPQTHKPYYDILTAGGQYNAIDTDELDGKVVIIQLMGTWCPNSLDQTNYLTHWYREVDQNNIVLMAVTYEPGNKEYSQKRIDSYSKSLNIPYAMYIGGSMSKGQAALAFPNMGKVNAFPTLVIIDKQGYIRYIHSYFNGPATGRYYLKFIEEFNAKVNELLSE
ncbi:MAG: TlpA family protein disulfide reductase [Cyclobacteriaceae bacterium]|nr:TlpA family protein disulfide reductase [Cyclobacteriaceae bacterium]